MKRFRLFLFLLTIFLPKAHCMEKQKSSENYFDRLPDELVVGFFSWVIPSYKNPKESYVALINAQCVEKRWFSLINDSAVTQYLRQQMYDRYALTADLHTLLRCTRESRAKYQQAIQTLKTIAQYALLHHNDLTLDIEEEPYPWQDLEFGAYCTALRKSYRKILNEIREGKKFTDLSHSINDDFEKLTMKQQPPKFKKLYPSNWNPYQVTAELLYLYNNTEEIVRNALHSLNFSERSVQFNAIMDNFKEFSSYFAWQPTYLRITDVFNKDNGSLKDKYLEMSKKLYTFT